MASGIRVQYSDGPPFIDINDMGGCRTPIRTHKRKKIAFVVVRSVVDPPLSAVVHIGSTPRLLLTGRL